MTLAGCLIIERESGWTVHVGSLESELPAQASDSEICQCVQDLSAELGWSSARCVLAPNAKSCYFARIGLQNDLDAKDRSALRFALEDYLPVDAESLVVEFGSPISDVLPAIAVPWQRWTGLIEQLEDQDCQVVSIIPETILAVAGLRSTIQSMEGERIWIMDDSGCEVVGVRDHFLVQWSHLAINEHAIRRHVRLHPEWVDAPIIAPESRLDLFRRAGVQGDLVGESTTECRLAAAESALGGRWGRWPDFRQDELSPIDPLRPIAKQLRRLALVALICFVVVYAAAWYRSQRIESRISNLFDEQREVYENAFPDQRVPVLLMRHVRREHTKVIGSRGRTGSPENELSAPSSATQILQTLLGGLPQNVRFRIVEMDIQNGVCNLTVRVRESGGIGIIAKSLESAGFDVTPPATQQIEPSRDEPILTYESIISATWNPSSDKNPSSDNGDTRRGAGGAT